MDNEALIEMIATRIEAGYIIMSNPENARRDAQAALAAIANSGTHAVVPREVIVQAWDAITELCDKRNLMTDENAELLNSLAAALAGRPHE